MYKIGVYYLAFKFLHKNLKHTVTEIGISIMSWAASLHLCLSLRTLKLMSSNKAESKLNHLENIFIYFSLWAEECDRGQRKFH